MIVSREVPPSRSDPPSASMMYSCGGKLGSSVGEPATVRDPSGDIASGTLPTQGDGGTNPWTDTRCCRDVSIPPSPKPVRRAYRMNRASGSHRGEETARRSGK